MDKARPHTGVPEDNEISAMDQRRLHARKPRANELTAKRRAEFLDHFAASCNLKQSAAAIGISRTALYKRRRTDAGFRRAWALAQEQGYVVLEAELLRRSRELLEGREVTEEMLDSLNGMDAKLAFAILQNHQKNAGKEPGDIKPQRSDLSEATKRLEKVMRRMKLLAEDAPEGTAK